MTAIALRRADNTVLTRHGFALAIVLITVIGTAARLALLPRMYFHSDEYLSLFRSWLVYGGDYFIQAIPSQKPPFMYYLLAGCYHLLGYSKSVALIPGTLAAIALIPTTGLLFRQIFKDNEGAILVSLLIAISPLQILFGPTIFLDPLMIVLAMGGLLAVCTDKPLLGGILGGLSIMTKQQGVLFVPLIVIASLLYTRSHPRWRSILWLICGYAVTLALLYFWAASPEHHRFFFIKGQIKSESGAIGGEILIDPLIEGFGIYLIRLKEWLLFFPLFFGALTVPLIIGALLCFIGLGIHIASKRDREQYSWLLWTGLLMGFALSVIGLHLIVRFRYVDRYILPSLPFFALGVAAVIQKVGTLNRLGRCVALASWASLLIGCLLIDTNIKAHALVPLVTTKPRPIGVFNADLGFSKGDYLERIRAVIRPETEIYLHGYLYPSFRVEFPEQKVLRSLEWPVKFLKLKKLHKLNPEKNPPPLKVERLVIWPTTDIRRMERLVARLNEADLRLIPVFEVDSEIGVYWIVDKS